jgi:GTPase SAR1 family protein
MSQYFKPPRPSHRRHKILIWGLSGTGKTTLALQFPHCAFIDNHGSAEKYEAAYPQHLFAHPNGPDDTMAAVASLVKDPADRKTLVLDDLTTYWGQVQEKWAGLFLARLPKSKGHHAEFYSLQPSDWIHPKRELKALIMRAIALDMNVIAVARAQKEYAGEGDNFMKVIGETFAGEKNLPYEFDYIIELRREGDKRVAMVHKQRIAPGQKPLPERFEFSIDAQGKSNFVEFISQYGNPEDLTRDAQRVPDPVLVKEPLASEPPATAPPQPSSPPGNGGPTEAQLDRLKELKTHYNIDNAEWGQTLQKFYGVTTAKALVPDQADHFIHYLESGRIPF